MFFYTSSPHPVKIVWGSTSLRLFYCKGLLCSLFKTWITPWGCQAPDPANCIKSDLRFNHITTWPFSCFCIIFFLSQFFNTCIISFLIWYFDPPHVGITQVPSNWGKTTCYSHFSLSLHITFFCEDIWKCDVIFCNELFNILHKLDIYPTEICLFWQNIQI